MNTTENNKLIAEFMGEKSVYNIKSDIDPMGYYDEHNDKPNFHSSWDWLMLVVEKIEVLGYSFVKYYQPIDKDWQCLIVKGYDILFQEFDEDSLKATYEAVVEFIKYYNKNKED